MRSITLIGYMCVGKTTIGKALAQRLGCTFYDLDWYIEERFHSKVSEIFARDGEDKFRDLERRMLHEVVEFENVVVACGGGTPCFFDNIDYMNTCSTTVYLRATADTILEHLSISRGKRPLLEGKTVEELNRYVRKQLSDREPCYMKAKYIQEISPLNDFDKINNIAEQIITKLNITQRQK